MIYTLIVAAFPILSLLKTPGFGMSLGTALSFALFAVSLIHTLTRGELSIRRGKPMLPFMFYLIFQYTALYLMGSEIGPNATNAVLLMSLNIVTFTILGYPMFDLARARRTVEILSMMATTYVILQTVFQYGTGIVLPTLPQSIRYLDYADETLAIYGPFFRPAAFFVEPAQFTQYVIVGLASALFPGENKRVRFKLAAFLSLGILLSTSGMGIFLVACAWFLYAWSRKSRWPALVKPLHVAAFALVAILLGMQLYQASSIFANAIDRVLGISFTGENAITGRTWSYVLYEKLDDTSKLWGVGYGNYSGYYMTSFVESLYYNGIAGTVLLMLIFPRYLRNVQEFHRVLVIITFLLIFIGNTFTATGVAFYFSFIVAGIGTEMEYGQERALRIGRITEDEHAL